MVITDSVKPTVAMASAPKRDTNQMSAMEKRDSMTISRTIGTERMNMALPTLLSVKSRSVPAIASLISCHQEAFSPPVNTATNLFILDDICV